MSKQALERWLQQRLGYAEKYISEVARTKAESAAVNQTLIWSPQTRESLKLIAEKYGVDSTSLLHSVRMMLIAEHKAFDYNMPEWFDEFLKRNNYVWGHSAFYISGSHNRVWSVILKTISAGLVKLGASNVDPELIKKDFNLDHGVSKRRSSLKTETIAGQAAQFAVPLAIREAVEIYDPVSLIDAIKYNFEQILKENNYTKTQLTRRRSTAHRILASWDQIASESGELSADVFVALQLATAEFNVKTGAGPEARFYRDLMEALAVSIEDSLEDFHNAKGSSTLKQKIGKIVLKENFADKIVSKNKKVKIDKEFLDAELKTKSKAVIKKKRSAVKLKNQNTKLRDPKTGRFISKEQAQSPVNILAMLNAKLPETVARNMIFPALRYRTGRFANSVRAISVDKTPQGFNSVAYTYQKYPYQTFEPGFAQGTPERDPRTLIDKSIREIATSFMQERFYTRRI